MRALSLVFAGVLFGFGLAYSEMTDRLRVLGFLDPIGGWDPTLLFVMLGAVGVTFLLFPWIRRRGKPLYNTCFSWPEKRVIDLRLVLGAGLFGVGWGLAGYCPGPAIAAIGFGGWNPLFFVVGMAAGMAAVQRARL